MKPDRRPISSKLNPFATELLAMDGAGKKLPELQQWLKERGMAASTSCISNFLSRVRTSRTVAAIPGRIDYRLPYYPKLQRELKEQRRRGDKWYASRHRTKVRKARWYQEQKAKRA